MKKIMTRVVVGLIVLLVFYGLFLNHVDQYQAGLAWNFMSGELWLQEPGYHLTKPWVLVANLDTRPQRVCVTSASHAAFNCKLVQFQSSAWRQFVVVEGWRYYWLANRLSFNWGYREEYRGFRDVLRGYAFGVERYPFIEVLEDYQQK